MLDDHQTIVSGLTMLWSGMLLVLSQPHALSTAPVKGLLSTIVAHLTLIHFTGGGVQPVS